MAAGDPMKAIYLSLLLLVIFGSSAQAQEQCPATAKSLGQEVSALSCYCEGEPEGSVWGTEIYTNDSSICMAAKHAGLFNGERTELRIELAEGCRVYLASEKNGVSSGSWGPWNGSFFFPQLGNASCVELAQIATAEFLPEDGSCPSSLLALRGRNESFSCSCTAEASQTGSVWGDGRYTDDSSICAAALHAGVISSSGGEVKLHLAEGCESYQGSTRNNVTSNDYDAWPGSFYFPALGLGQCTKKPHTDQQGDGAKPKQPQSE